MSRTYRRMNQPKLRGWFEDIAWYTSEWIWAEGAIKTLYRRPFPKDSKEYKKGKARYHSDGATHSCKEPGPSHFRRMVYHRPLRVAIRNELAKWYKNNEYEIVADPIRYLPYWT